MDNLTQLQSDIDDHIDPMDLTADSVTVANHNAILTSLLQRAGKYTGFPYTATQSGGTTGNGMFGFSGNPMNNVNDFDLNLTKITADLNDISVIVDGLNQNDVLHFKDFTGRSGLFTIQNVTDNGTYYTISVKGSASNLNYAYQATDNIPAIIEFVTFGMSVGVSITNIDIMPTANTNEFTVSIDWIDGSGNPQTTTDSTPISVNGATTSISDNLTLNTTNNNFTISLSEDGTVTDTLTLVNPTGLEAIDEGNGIGYRVIGRDPANYGDIGENAIDLSFSSVASTTNGATGGRSHAQGFNTVASGFASHAQGIDSVASGVRSSASGNNTIASGQNSFAANNNNEASGEDSASFGAFNEVSGVRSFAANANNEITADDSASFGVGNTITSNGSFTANSNNTITGNRSFAANADNTVQGAEAAAFGSGNVSSGDSSFSANFNNEARGTASVSFGMNNLSSSDFSATFGSDNISSGLRTFVANFSNEATGTDSAAFGFSNKSQGNSAFTANISNTAPSFGETSIGLYSTNYTPTFDNQFFPMDRVFNVGVGDSETNRIDAFTIYKNGGVTIHPTAAGAIGNAQAGMLRFNSNTNKHQGYDGTQWNDLY